MQLEEYCPQVRVGSTAYSGQDACQMMQKKHPQLVFLQMGLASGEVNCLLEDPSFDFETIVLSSGPKLSNHILPIEAGSYLFKPVQAEALINAVQHAQHWIHWKEEQRKNQELLDRFLHQRPENDIIGIPTMEGMDFLKIGEILRCEGLQRFTRIVTTAGKGIISSYHIGVFRYLLENQGFFSPHKSHLVNLQDIRKLLREGTLVMRDGSTVPVARRRRLAFLEQIKHL